MAIYTHKVHQNIDRENHFNELCFFLVHTANEFGVFGIPLCVVSDRNVKEEFPEYTLVLEMQTPDERNLFRPLCIRSQRASIHAMEPRPSPLSQGVVFLIEGRGEPLLHWVAHQGLKPQQLNKMCQVCGVAPAKKSEKMAATAARCLGIEKNTAAFKVLENVYNRTFVSEANKKRRQPGDGSGSESEPAELAPDQEGSDEEWAWANTESASDILDEWEKLDKRFFKDVIRKRARQNQDRRPGTFSRVNPSVQNAYIYRVSSKSHYLGLVKDKRPIGQRGSNKFPFKRQTFPYDTKLVSESDALEMCQQFVVSLMKQFGHENLSPPTISESATGSRLKRNKTDSSAAGVPAEASQSVTDREGAQRPIKKNKLEA